MLTNGSLESRERLLAKAGVVMIVENDLNSMHSTEIMLRTAGFQVIQALGGEDALFQVQSRQVDVIVMDTRLKGMTGYEVCRKLKADERTTAIPIVFLTARHGEVGDLVHGLEVGATDYVIKPYENAELLARVGTMMRIKRMEDELRRMTTTDSLTGLRNRRFLDARLDEEFSRAVRYGSALSCIMADIDHFKKVNDTYGHKAGDEVLCHVARITTLGLRKEDVSARYGGEEIAIILPQTYKRAAGALAERIRANLENTPITVEDKEIRVTLSIGVADLTCGDMDRSDRILSYADSALYDSKRNGRNRVTVAGSA